MSHAAKTVRLSCHPNVVAEPVGYLRQPVTTHVWTGETQQVVIFECGECAGHWASDITREEWLRAGESQMSTDQHREQARQIVDKFRYGYPPVQSVRFLEWEPLVEQFASALSSRDAEIREVLEGLEKWPRVGEPCWCGYEPHLDYCVAARTLWSKLQPKESSDVTE